MTKDTETLLAYLQGELDPDQITSLEKRLLEEDDLRKTIVELSTEEAALTDWAKAERVSIALDNDAFGEPDPKRKTSFSGNAGWWAAAAILILSAISFAWMNRTRSAVDTINVAHLVASADAEWQGVAPSLNSAMALGRYQLNEGMIDLLFAGGAKVSVSGPANFDLKSTRHIHLDSGNLVAQIPDEALGFVVTSPQSEVVDLGTEFGLSVSESGQTEVHVLDGLVEVLPMNRGEKPTKGVMISEGEARRFTAADSTGIPVASRSGLMGDQFGLRMLRGSVRLVESLTKNDLIKKTGGRNWIDLIAEKKGVSLSEPLEVSINSPGSHRDFSALQQTLPSETKLNSYLLHFRPGSTNHVSGVIRFDQPIVAILCTGKHLKSSDELFGIPSVHYPAGANSFRGLEPNGFPTARGQQAKHPDEIVLSQEMHTISIHTFANTERGYDQIRVLTRAN